MHVPRRHLRLACGLAAAMLAAAIQGCGEEKPAPAPAPPATSPLLSPEKVRVRHILVQYVGARGANAQVQRSKTSADSLARSLRQRIGSGTDLGALAREFSDDASAAEGGEIAPLEPGETPPEFEQAAMALAIGETSAVVESPYGFHIIQRLGSSVLAAQHILIRFAGASGAPDTVRRSRTEALALAEKILAEVRNPDVSFPVAASRYSEDADTAHKGGWVGEFVPGKMVKPFEDAVAGLQNEQISGIVETPYGFHVIKRVEPKVIRVAHILIRHAGAGAALEGPGIRGRDEALQRALDVLFRARNGEDFAALALEYSEDKMTADNGGRLPPLMHGQTVPQFEDAAFRLAPGEISNVVETAYGFHVIRRVP